jgi:spore germination protein GerM
VKRIAVALLAVVVIATACGIPTSEQADVVAKKDVPLELLSPKVPSSSTTSTTLTAGSIEPLYFVNGANLLVKVPRAVAAPADLELVLDELLRGPSPTQTAFGLTSALPANVRVRGTAVINGVVTIRLNNAFTSISGDDQILAVGQLVLTVTSQPGATRVSFMVANAVVPVPTATGASTTAPVTAADYSTLLAH